MAGYQSRDDSYTRPGVSDEMKWQPVMRGFPEDVEVLTEVGWVLMGNLYRAGVQGLSNGSNPLFEREIDWRTEHKPLRENWAATRSKHELAYEYANPNQIDFTKWSVGNRFPKVATLTSDHMTPGTQHGRITFQRPEFAIRFLYHDLQLVHLKRRGVDMLLPRFTDILVKNKFQSQWVFSVADDFCVVRKGVAGAYKSMVNRYSPAGVFYGDVDAEQIVQLSSSGELNALMKDEFPVKMVTGGKHASRVRIWDGYPYPPIRDAVSGKYVKNPMLRNSMECYNLSLPVGSSHTLIVRRAGHTVEGEKPQTLWTGFPLVVGDGYDKTRIALDRVQGFHA